LGVVGPERARGERIQALAEAGLITGRVHSNSSPGGTRRCLSNARLLDPMRVWCGMGYATSLNRPQKADEGWGE